MKLKEHLLQIAIAFDQFLNAISGGYGDETLSSRAWRTYLETGNSFKKDLINAIFFWQENHCKEAFESELARRHLPPSMR